MSASVAAALLFAVAAYRLRLLSRSGSIAAGLFGACLLVFGGASWTVPVLAFFGGSSLLSKLGRTRKRAAEGRAEKGWVRAAGQVLANGGAGWALLLVHAAAPSPLLYAGFVGAFAAAAADTWATELGTLARGRPRLVTTGRPVPPGTSGAVSVPGTLGGALGAASVWAAALPWTLEAGGLAATLVLVAAGLGGMLADSLLGATVQAQYREPATGELTERRGPPERPYPLARGRRFWTNDRVNLGGTAVGAVLAMALLA